MMRTFAAAIIAPPHDGPGARVAPLGAMAVAAYVERELGRQAIVTIYDLDGEDAEIDLLLERLERTRPTVIGFQIFSSHVAQALVLANKVRARIPKAVLVAGGHHPTLTWNHFVRSHGRVFDFTINGDGEVPFTELIRRDLRAEDLRVPPIPGTAFLDEDGRVQAGPSQSPIGISDVANMLSARVIGGRGQLMFSDLSAGRTRQAVALISSRSCPLKCSFCSIITMPGKWRASEADAVVGWLRESFRERPFSHVYFMDANFFVVPRRVREIAQGIADAFEDVTWSASSTVRMFLKMKEDVPALVKSGLRMVELGIESGSQRQLQVLNKEVTVAENLEAVNLLQENGLQIGLDYIMFYPEQTIMELRENLDFLDQAGLLLERSWDHYLNTLELYPGTPLRDIYAQRLGLQLHPDELPDPTRLFFDPAVANIHRLFTISFAPEWFPLIDTVYADLMRAVRRMKNVDSVRASEFLLEAVALRRLPFRVLMSMMKTPMGDLETAVDWLPSARARIDQVHEAALRTTEALAVSA